LEVFFQTMERVNISFLFNEFKIMLYMPIHVSLHHEGQKHSYDILGAGMLRKPKKTRKFVKIRTEECFDKVLNEEF
jgi:hypothetical protein